MKKVLYFPGHSVSLSSTEYQRKKMMAKLRNDLMQLKLENDIEFSIITPMATPPPPPTVDVILNYIVKFPIYAEHRNHHQGLAAGLIEPLDEQVFEHIKTLVRNGSRRKAEIISRTNEFVNGHIFTGECRFRCRFKPERKTINNIVASVKLETKYSSLTKKT